MFCFHLDQPKDVDDTLKHETEFIIKSNESLAENQIKNKIDQLLLKHKHENNFHEHKKQSQKFGTQGTEQPRISHRNLFLVFHNKD